MKRFKAMGCGKSRPIKENLEGQGGREGTAEKLSRNVRREDQTAKEGHQTERLRLISGEIQLLLKVRRKNGGIRKENEKGGEKKLGGV